MVAQKKKDGMPKKHGPKKREKKKGVAMSEKIYRRMIRERENQRFKELAIPPFIYPPIHTLAPFDRDCMTCFSMDPLFDFTIYGIQVCPVLTLP
jgi:hypothetical protein